MSGNEIFQQKNPPPSVTTALELEATDNGLLDYTLTTQC